MLSNHGNDSPCKTRNLVLLLAAAIALQSLGCKPAASPETTFQSIREEMRQGQLDAAQRDVESALAKYQPRSQEWSARFLVLKAHVLFLRGSYKEALALLTPELPDSLKRSDAAVQRKIVQGLAYTYLQQYSEADIPLTEAEILGRDIDSYLQGDVEQARGILEMDRKDYPKATAAYLAAAAFARRKNLPTAELRALASLGNIARWQEHYDEAIDRFKDTVEKARLLRTTSAEVKALGNLGWSYFAVGDFENAEKSLTDARSKSGHGDETADQIRWLNLLADIYSQQHRYADADSIGREALALANNQEDKRILTGCLNALSEITLATGRLEEAQKFNRQALDVENAGLDTSGIASSTIIAGRIALAEKRYLPAEQAFKKIIPDEKVETPLRWEAQARLAEVFAVQGKTRFAERQFLESIAKITKAWDAVEREESRLSFLSAAIDFYDQYVNFLISQSRPLDALKVADLSRAQTLEHGLSLGSPENSSKLRPREPVVSSLQIRPEQIARRQNAVLLFYWLGQSRSYLWAITPAKTSMFQLPPDLEIAQQVKAYNESFLGPVDPLESGNPHGQKLYETLIRPAEKLIPANSRVIILPDNSLNNLNFETLLVSGSKPHYWIEDVTLSTASSLSLLSRSRSASSPNSPNLLLFGDALFASKDFPVLPDAGKETELLKKYFPESRRALFTKADAKASAYFSSGPGKYSYVHFATHGTASSARPLESAIILSPEGDSFKLYARDIIQRPLTAYLVTISACNGAGVKVYAGEGLVGLAWAFLRAGAHNVIGGLWEVSNASTPQLIDELYKGLSQGEDPAEALRNAKLKFIHSNEYYRGPFYWAPFQLYSGS